MFGSPPPSTFASGGCAPPPQRADLFHTAEPLPIMVRAIRARSALKNPRALSTVKPDCSDSPSYVCKMSRQGFGKRKNMVGAPRAKKARPPRMESEGSGISGATAAFSSTEEASPCGPMELELGSAESSDEAENKELQKEAAALTKAARKSVSEATVEVRKAEAALRHERRLDEERERRWWAAFGFGQRTRIRT